jgi:ABC-type molybdenum transport system ATPase subunit/photorepair protein PhrA
MKNLYLLRGLPGAGKSTLANQIGGTHFEADMYFINENGEYIFNGADIKKAHQWCQSQVELAMIQNHITYGLDSSDIVVSNTFTQGWEMELYYKLAESYGYRVFSLIVENRHGGENQHGVPADKIEEMRVRFEFRL